MNNGLAQMEKGFSRLGNASRMDTFELYHGIELSFLSLRGEGISLCHDAMGHVLAINHCKGGRLGWKMENENTVYLGQGDYSLHTMDACARSAITLPNGDYKGLALCIDLNVFTQDPPALLAGTGITGNFLLERFCGCGRHASFAASAQTESIFAGFYGQPEHLRLSYWRVKAAELLLYLAKREVAPSEHLEDCRADQVAIIRQVHKQLEENLEKHWTIDALAKQFLINPTTLKTVFKAVYGNSIAAHMREHRMEHAGRLLLETQDRISEIAQAIGYENQSKFTAAFKEYHQMLPTQYRKQHRT